MALRQPLQEFGEQSKEFVHLVVIDVKYPMYLGIYGRCRGTPIIPVILFTGHMLIDCILHRWTVACVRCAEMIRVINVLDHKV